MSKMKSVGARSLKLPSWIWLLPAFIILGWSHFKDVENERIKQSWTTRIEAAESKFESTESSLKNYKADAKILEKKVAAAKARGVTDAQKQAFLAETARLDSQLVLIDEGSKQARAMLGRLQADKDAGLFDER